jgi:hypothetical protein
MQDPILIVELNLRPNLQGLFRKPVNDQFA